MIKFVKRLHPLSRFRLVLLLCVAMFATNMLAGYLATVAFLQFYPLSEGLPKSGLIWLILIGYSSLLMNIVNILLRILLPEYLIYKRR